MPRAGLDDLSATELQAVLESLRLLEEWFDGLIQSILLFGSKA